MTKFEEKLEILPIKNIEHPVGDTKYYAAVHVKTLIAQADEEIANLKSQLQQQALPVVPEFVAEWIEHCKGMGYGLTASLTFKLSSTMHEEISAKILKWLGNEGNDETFALAFITRKYQVEKPQLFYLREKNTNYYLNKSKNNGLELVPNPYFDEDNQFTQQEIDSMQTGSYELVPVEDGE